MKIVSKKQGELDGLCGIYSITNAIMLLTEIEADITFEFALKSLFDDKNPLAVVNGLGIGTLRDTLSRTIIHLNSGKAGLEEEDTEIPYTPNLNFKIPFWKTKQNTRRHFQEEMMKISIKNGTVAILGYDFNNGNSENSYSHWTVIKSVTESNLMTYDSDDEYSRISWDKILVTSNDPSLSSHRKRPYLVRPRDLVLITNE
jgi:hypothetical protein